MEFKEFGKKLQNQIANMGMQLSERELQNFYNYMNMILEWNEKINLTAIIDKNEFIVKHFVDSLMINKDIKGAKSLIDVGTGAGFPGIPLKIANPELKITLMDSLNKRIKVLDNIIDEIKLKDIATVHGRAEELGKNNNYREMYDIATARAVAALPVLVEYLMPFIKVGGRCICMKGSNVLEELENAKAIIYKLGGEIEKIETTTLPNTDMERNIIIIKKVKNTPDEYPRHPNKIRQN